LTLLLVGSTVCWSGGACARLAVCMRCARAPSRISVHDRAVRPAGDMMVDGVIPLGEAVRPLGRWRPSTRTWRQDDAGSRPRCIGVSEDRARKTDSRGLQRLVAELAQGVVAALEQLARDREARAVAAEPLGRLEVVVAVGAAVPAGRLGGFVERPAQRGRSLPGEVAGRAALV
jgi:hypothetical protein